jgi:hypothetical protein
VAHLHFGTADLVDAQVDNFRKAAQPDSKTLSRSILQSTVAEHEYPAGARLPVSSCEFLRATAKDRAEYNKIALCGGGNPGWATINDVRNWDDMDEYEGGNHI